MSNASGTVIEQNDYYPYGMRHDNASHIVSAGNRYKFSGKELETTGNLSTIDFGCDLVC